MSKHTPGPWSAAAAYGHWGRAVHSASGLNIGAVFHVHKDVRDPDGRIVGQEIDPERLANACLMEAAPELLEALMELLKAVEGVPVGPEAKCRAAIAKATSGQNESSHG